MATKKYVSPNRLSLFLDKLKDLFATKTEVAQKSQVQIVTIGETESLEEVVSTLKIHKLTKEQYEERLNSGNIDESALYLTPDEEIDLSGYVTVEQFAEKADVNHTHDIDDINELQATLDGLDETIANKAEVEHMHFAKDITNLQELLNEMVSKDITINGKSLASDIVLSATDVGADVSGSAEQALDDAKSYTEDLLKTKANIDHVHDDIYYTESEIDTKISELNILISDIVDGTTVVEKANYATDADNAHIADSAIKATQDSNGNVIGTTYETKHDASLKLIEAKSYADNIKNDLLNGAGDAYDTLKELGDLIDDNTDAIDALEMVAVGKADKIHIHDDLYYTETEINEKLAIVNASISSSANEAKTHSNTNLNIAKSYTDDAVAQKTQVQIITWEDDD